MFALSLGDAFVKLLSNNFVLWQIFVTRSLIAVPCILIFMLCRDRGAIRLPAALGWTIMRSLLLVIMWVCYYISLSHIPLSVAAAAYYTLPIFIALLSAILLGERISLQAWVSVMLGFIGVVLILKPETKGFNWYTLLPLASAILYALAMILTRTKCRTEHPLILSLHLNICFIVVGGAAAALLVVLPLSQRHGFLLGTWPTMGFTEWLSMCVLAISLLVGSIGAAIAYQNAPPSIIGVFDFAYVGFAILWSIVFFAETPDLVSMIGVMFIVIAGILSLRS